MIAQLLPSGVVGVEMRDIGQDLPLHQKEAALVAGAVTKRQRELALGRACAHAAMAQISADIPALLRNTDGAPVAPFFNDLPRHHLCTRAVHITDDDVRACFRQVECDGTADVRDAGGNEGHSIS